jgi:hypothetical protein
MNLEDRIRYEGESTTLDFKKSYYAPQRRADLISDVMAMANADTRDDRFIVFGVKQSSDGTKTFHSLESFPDSAEIEQLLLQNIEPTIPVEFAPFEYEGHALAYLRIHDCIDKPYLMRKDFAPLTQGTGRIRKGTTTLPLLRTDIDRIYEVKAQSQDLRQFLSIQWDCDPPSKEITVRRSKNDHLPSKIEAAKIQSHIDRLLRIESDKKPPKYGSTANLALQGMMSDWNAQNEQIAALGRSLSGLGLYGGGKPQDRYKGLPLDELNARLERVAQDFREEDVFYLFMEQGFALNLQILNEGPQYLDDAVLILTLPNDPRLKVASKSPRKTSRSSSPFDLNLQHLTPDLNVYPSVEITEEEITVQAHIKQLQNGVPRGAFQKPLRILLHPEANPEPIPVRLKLVARGLQSPFEDLLFIRPE